MSIHFKGKNILYIEPDIRYFEHMSKTLFPDIDTRRALRVNVDRAESYYAAIKRVRSKVTKILDGETGGKKEITSPYDIIFCEYELRDGKTAQDLLNIFRNEEIIPESTIFIMIATKEHKDKVLAVLEHLPDAYIYKGKSQEDMEARITLVMKDRAELRSIYAPLDKKDYAQALMCCDEYILAKKRLTIFVMGLRAKILLKLHDYEGSKKACTQIIELENRRAELEKREVKIAPAVQGRLAESLHHLGETEKAEKILTGLVNDFPEFLGGYDLLTEVYQSTDRPEEAQKVLSKATERSPHRFDRQKLLGLTALENNDHEGAKEAFKRLTTSEGRLSNSGHPENLAHMSEIHLHLAEKAILDEKQLLEEIGELKLGAPTPEETILLKEKEAKRELAKRGQQENKIAANDCVKRIKVDYKGTEFEDVAQFCAATMEYNIHTKNNDSAKAKIALNQAVELHKKGVNIGEMSTRMQVNFACGCIEEGHEEIGANVIEQALQNSPRKEAVMKQAGEKLKNNPIALQSIKEVEKKAEKNLSEELEMITKMYMSGQKELAIRQIQILLKENPNSPDILAKTVDMCLKSIDVINPDIELFNATKKHLNTLTRIKSTHPEKDTLLKQSALVESAIGLMNLRAIALKNSNNPESIVPAIKAFFLHLNTKGFDSRIFAEANELLEKLVQNKPDHTDIPVLQGQQERIRKKHQTSGNTHIQLSPSPIPKKNIPLEEKPKKISPIASEKTIPNIEDDDLSAFIL